MKAERAEQRALFLKNVGKLRKGWQDVPTRQLLRQRRVLNMAAEAEQRVPIGEILRKIRTQR